MKKFFIGVDVSKLKLDFCFWHNEKVVSEMIVLNHTECIKEYLLNLLEGCSITDFLVCAEYTGQYTYPLSSVCTELGLDLWLENFAFHIQIGVFAFILGGVMSLAVGMLSISFHILKVASSNPVNAIKYE